MYTTSRCYFLLLLWGQNQLRKPGNSHPFVGATCAVQHLSGCDFYASINQHTQYKAKVQYPHAMYVKGASK